jgi:lysophospholipase L1-like esterase
MKSIINTVFYIGIAFTILISAHASSNKRQHRLTKTIKYLPLGDSYTIGTGVSDEESWPFLLSRHVQSQGILLQLADTPARNGYTTQDLIEKELPVFERLNPDVVTVAIGVNDWVRGVSEEEFAANLSLILDALQAKLKNPKNILLVTIPDFGVTAVGKNYARGRNIREGIAAFNRIIAREATARNLALADVFELSKKMEFDKTLVAGDGLHPSAKAYILWEEEIFPAFISLVKEKRR